MYTKNYIGMILTLLGVLFMAYPLAVGIFSTPMKISSIDALLFIVGSYFIIAGVGFWIGEVPKEVIARVRKEIMGAKEEKK